MTRVQGISNFTVSFSKHAHCIFMSHKSQVYIPSKEETLSLFTFIILALSL